MELLQLLSLLFPLGWFLGAIEVTSATGTAPLHCVLLPRQLGCATQRITGLETLVLQKSWRIRSYQHPNIHLRGIASQNDINSQSQIENSCWM
uniref:Putative secreted protein n=1 Tax=Ixodes ricinus TaxID=34613 RepID=A0A6B0U2A8_IXORI